MKGLGLVLFLSALVCSASARADVNPTAHLVRIERAFLIDGFDENDVAQVVIKGTFPSTCYKIGPTDLWVNHIEGRVELKQLAYLYRGDCLRVLVPFHQTVNLGLLRAGSFEVRDAKFGKGLGKLTVVEIPEGGIGTDDYLYAPLQDAYVEGLETARPYLVMRGKFQDDCLSFRQTKVAFKNDVLVVQPIVERKKETGCKEGNYPFKKYVRIREPLSEEFLLHVRVMNGQSINKVYTRQ